jgi:phosphoglycolate phosphatase
MPPGPSSLPGCCTQGGASDAGAAPQRPATAGRIEAVIFDLDGTLIDTAEEIALALGSTFAELGLPTLPRHDVAALIGRGIHSMVQRALRRVGEEAAAARPEPVVARFEAHYAEVVATCAEPFPGVRDGLERLQAQRIPLAVVTNKLRWFSERLLDRLQLSPAFVALIAGDDGLPRKPAGAMLEAACRRMGSRAPSTLMLGDSDNDVLAARRAGCPVWCVPYGYNEGRPVETLACDRVVESVAEAAQLIVAG